MQHRSWAACAALPIFLTVFPAFSLPSGATPTNADLLTNVVDALGAPTRNRPQGASSVATFRDARAVVVLTYMARFDGHPTTALTATDGLGALARSGRSDALAALLQLGQDVRPDVGERAVMVLGSLAPRKPAWDALFTIVSNAGLPQSRRRAALSTMRRRFPELAAKTRLPRLSGPAAIPTLGGAVAGGYAFSVLGRYRSDGAEALGWLTGALIGGGTGFLIGREQPLDAQALYLSGMGWGVVTGELLARSLIEVPKHSTAGTFGVALEIAGFVGAWAMEERLRLTAEDVAFVDVSAFAGLLVGYGASELLFQKLGSRGRNTAVTLGTVGALAASIAWTKDVKLDGPDRALQAFGALEGWWYGMWLGDILHTSRSEREQAFFRDNADISPGTFPVFQDNDPDQWVRDASVGGRWLGAGVGYFAATIASQYTDLGGGDVPHMFVLATFGKILGGGVAALASNDGDRQMATSLAGGAIGIAAGALTLRDVQYDAGDIALLPIVTGWGFFHGVAVSTFLQDGKKIAGDQDLGLTLTSGALFGLGAIVAGQKLNLTALEATMATTGAFWGAWIAGWSSTLVTKSAANQLLASAVGGDLGAAVTALMISPYFDVDPLVLAGASFGGLSMAGVSSLIALMVGSDSGDVDALTRVNLAGSVVGLALGGWLTNRWLKSRDKRKPSVASASDFAANPGFSWFRGLQAAPVMVQGQMTGASLQLSGAW